MKQCVDLFLLALNADAPPYKQNPDGPDPTAPSGSARTALRVPPRDVLARPFERGRQGKYRSPCPPRARVPISLSCGGPIPLGAV